jgi:hypothetical protein
MPGSFLKNLIGVLNLPSSDISITPAGGRNT